MHKDRRDPGHRTPQAKYYRAVSPIASSALALLSAFALGACSSDMDKVKALADEFCACKDEACTVKIMEKAQREIPDERVMKLMKDQDTEFMKVIERMVECATKLRENSDVPAEMPFLPAQEMPEFPSVH